MKKILRFSFLAVYLLFNNSFAQQETAVMFISIPVSPSIISIGGAGSSLLTDDPYGFLHNPAQLGYFGSRNNLAGAFPSTINPLMDSPIGFPKDLSLEIKSAAINLGFNLKNLTGLPLSFGFGYARPEISFYEIPVHVEGNIIGNFVVRDYYDTYSLGLGYDYYLQFYGGISYKHITSILTPSITGDFNAIDFGFLINVPVLRILNNELPFLIERIPANPFINLSFGYTRQNLGNEVYYIDRNQTDPLPRMLSLGYGLSIGINVEYNKYPANLIKLEFTSEAQDLLITRDENTGIEYQSGLGDISIGKHIIGIKGDEKVINRSGVKVNLLETISYRTGKYNGRFFDNRKTSGFELRTKGLFLLLSSMLNINMINYLAEHVDIRYNHTTYNYFPHFDTKAYNFILVLSGYSIFN
jgi:hypothetical protein